MSTILVTGANRGIGFELCRQYRGRGDEVIAVCRKAGEELKSLGVRVEQGIDVGAPEQIAELATRLAGVKIDVLLNNAGLLRNQTLGKIGRDGVDDMLRQYAVNSIAPLLVTQALLPNLGAGSKVGIVTSRVGSVADNTSGGNYGYRMSKAAANMAGKTLAEDLRERNIAVILLHPGYVRTGMTRGNGNIEADAAAAGLIKRVDELRMAATGTFRHANGEALPW